MYFWIQAVLLQIISDLVLNVRFPNNVLFNLYGCLQSKRLQWIAFFLVLEVEDACGGSWDATSVAEAQSLGRPVAS